MLVGVKPALASWLLNVAIVEFSQALRNHASEHDAHQPAWRQRQRLFATRLVMSGDPAAAIENLEDPKLKPPSQKGVVSGGWPRQTKRSRRSRKERPQIIRAMSARSVCDEACDVGNLAAAPGKPENPKWQPQLQDQTHVVSDGMALERGGRATWARGGQCRGGAGCPERSSPRAPGSSPCSWRPPSNSLEHGQCRGRHIRDCSRSHT